MDIREAIRSYIPFCEQEERDKELICRCLEWPDVFRRENQIAHMSASAWVVNEGRDKVLMAYHNIYRSWAWLGGHADGEENLLAVAMREVREESGVKNVRPVSEEIFSIEALDVEGHEKHGKYVSSHLHLNVTYLLEASEEQALSAKPDENSAVAWFSFDDMMRAVNEEWMKKRIYSKLIARLADNKFK